MCSVRILSWMITISLLGIINYSQAAWLRCYKGSLEEYVATPLDNPAQLISSCVDRSLPTVIYTFGYRGRVAGPATTAIMGAYVATRKRNVILLDWEEEARSGVLGIPLGYMLYAVPNAKKIGDQFGVSLVKLARAGMNMTQVHLLGHSLGAHVMAFAGRRTRESGYIVSRITGLDPARAIFEGPLAVHKGLDRTSARFVDIIHSDPGGYGTTTSTATVDIWPNYAGNGGTQPGCPSGNFEKFSPEDNITISDYEDYYPDYDIGSAHNLTNLQKLRMAMRPNLCSHDRSWRFFVEAITSPTAFPATSAVDYNDWVANNGWSTHMIYMGDLTSTRARGNFFLTTNSQSPYGKGEQGLRPDNNTNRRRRNSTLTRLLKYLR